MTIELVCFDLWNTLIEMRDYKDERVEYLTNLLISRKNNIDIARVGEIYDQVNNFGHDYAKQAGFRHIDTLDRIKQMIEILDVSLNKADIFAIQGYFESILLQNPPALKPHVKKVLESLHSNYKIALISDTGITPGSHLRRMCEKYDILQYFDTQTYSDETGYFKPHSYNFEYTLAQIGIGAENAVHIGDMLQTDVAGAKAAGMSAIWVRSPEYYQKEYEKFIPDAIIENLIELPGIIEQM